MYRMNNGQMSIYDFIHPFGGNLDEQNRWVKMSELIPWIEFEAKYAKNFSQLSGPRAKPFRMALGALLIQQIMKASDEETVQQITENVYLQYFIGLNEFQIKAPFDASLMTHFRKRIDMEMLSEINESIYCKQKLQDVNVRDDVGDNGYTHTTLPTKNQGKLLLDATCAPADIRYPTDVSLLNEARELLENLIDEVHKPQVGKQKRPRTYRKKARKSALNFLKKKNHSKKDIRTAVRKQLGYVKRNIQELDKLQELSGGRQLTDKQSVKLSTIKQLYLQQSEMHKEKKHIVSDRIVSIHQPHVRPIVRGKAAAKVEFGAKVEASLVNGFAFLDICSWDARNESQTLKNSVEKYREVHGYYPSAVLADQIYRTRDNRSYCQERGIRLSGPALGRPKASEIKEQMKLAREDSAERNAIEGKFGEAKRRFSLGRIMSRLKETAESIIGLQFLVMNLRHLCRVLFVQIFWIQFFAKIRRNYLCISQVSDKFISLGW